jgi:hypothetical protein
VCGLLGVLMHLGIIPIFLFYRYSDEIKRPIIWRAANTASGHIRIECIFVADDLAAENRDWVVGCIEPRSSSSSSS